MFLSTTDKFTSTLSSFSASSFIPLAAFLTNGAATTNETTVETTIPNNTGNNPPFGANAKIANTLPGDGVATNPALNIENTNIPAALPTIGANINTGFISIYGK